MNTNPTCDPHIRRGRGLICLAAVMVLSAGNCIAGRDSPTDDESSQPVPTALEVDPTGSDPPSITAVTLSNERVEFLIDQLQSDRFQDRQRAIMDLHAVRADQIRMLADAAESENDAEAGRRLFNLLENLYIGSDEQRVLAASETLERASSSERWLIAELAADILDRQWQRRSRLMIAELQSLGARFNSDDIQQFALGVGGRNNRFFLQQPIGLAQLQVKIDKAWNGGARGLELLERLGRMVTGGGPVGEIRSAVYLIDEHPLGEDEVIRLKTAFGDARVVPRGRVFLGISNSLLFIGEERGCRVGEVTDGTSAHAAGIQTDDIIRTVDDVPIRDFEHLVQLLRKYDVGDQVTMKIERGVSPYPLPDAPREIKEDPEPAEDAPPGIRGIRGNRGRTLSLEVRLQGW